ncbi:hypothetical protein MKY15_05700 [Sporosarcina sp. FSL K6-1540]|uniref:hypothetical protein n=1 Tax=Sporosarcina sp. FSL K6-1540 TaxID=2921555 RepID=UPI00315A04B1
MLERKNKTLIVFLTIIMSISGFLISGCSQDETGDPNKVVIQKVLEHQFTGPDKEFMDLLWNPKYKIVENGAERNSELDKYIEEVYGEYFTESQLDFFMRAFGTTYQSFADSNGYTLHFKEASIEQDEQVSNRYTFVAKVGYQKNGDEEKIINVEGLVLFSTKEEGKIGKFQYGNDNGFSDILRQ